MKLTYSVFLLFAAVGVYYAQAASFTRDTDVSDTSNASSNEDSTTAGNYSEVQKGADGETQETSYGTSNLDTGVEEHTTVKGERAEQVTATMNVTPTTSKASDESDVDPNIQGDIELLCNKSNENQDRDTARQKRQHPEGFEYDYSDLLDETE